MGKPEQVGNSLKWYTLPTEYYDVSDGTQITKKKALDKNLYIKIKTNKHVTTNKQTGTGTIKHTVECKRQPQGKLF